MQSTIAPHLRSTYELIRSSFPDGIDRDSYLPLLAILEQDMSDRNLAETISYYTKQDYSKVLNDVWAAQSTSIPSPESLERVKTRLLACGYEEWLNEA
ncbi:MAG: DUF3349 domain-containing protein [Cyanobacteria bacterium P01_G01_bin.19]